MKPERWGSPLVQESTGKKRPVTRDIHMMMLMMIMIIIIIILKYKDLTIEIQRMCNVKTRVIPVIIGANGTISKSFRKYVSDIPGNHDVKELQKTATLDTAHILRKVLT